MVRPHRADIECLDTADSTVVLELDAGEISQGVSDIVGRQSLQFLSSENLRHYDFGTVRHRDNLHIREEFVERVEGYGVGI